ncbi:MAG: N-formylglutamate amidohydrolase [Planctomycetes bacterium]|nr:N-formylglutamate amidohydrolase [Planctomycetota bacterium]
MTARFAAGAVVVSVEHASPAVPVALAGLGLDPRWLRGHHAWDPGAALAGRAIARAFGAPLHLARWSRLVADLNRSAHHRHVVARRLRPEGLPIPANVELDTRGRRARLERYWRPWRSAVERDLDAAVERHGVALHISVHSFTPDLGNGDPPRVSDFGLLYWPSRRRERALADRLDARLRAFGYSVRRNWPYSGLEDGFCMRLRCERSERRYVGMELEMNQRTCVTPDGARRMARVLIQALAPEIAARPPG